MTSKTTTDTSGSDTLETVVYEYNLQNRLSKVTTTPYVDNVAQTPEVVEYTYNPSGIRVQKIVDDTYRTDYLIDPANHTGYAQVLEEWTSDITTPADPVLLSAVYYTIGDDIIAQNVDGATEYLLYDGHGSTRQLANWTGTDVSVYDHYSYDGYGVLLQDDTVASNNPGRTLPQATNLLYAGEQFDTDAQQYYLRARYYNPANGLFNRTDPYTGNIQDPQSLHKYLYCHNNPVNGIDPSGNFTIVQVAISLAIISLVSMVVLPHVWARAGSYGINETTDPKRVAVVNGKLGFGHEWVYGWSGFNIHEYASELQTAGHTVTYSVQPNEDEFINILNSNEIVIVAAHGIDIWNLVAPGDMYDTRKKIFTGMDLGGTSSHPYDSTVRDSVTNWTITPGNSWVTANELDGKVTNSNLELIGIVCQLGKTKRIQQAISPGVFVGSDINLRGAQARDLLGYATDRVNGVPRNTAYNDLQSINAHYVFYH